jgi:hypothetical protein
VPIAVGRAVVSFDAAAVVPSGFVPWGFEQPTMSMMITATAAHDGVVRFIESSLATQDGARPQIALQRG